MNTSPLQERLPTLSIIIPIWNDAAQLAAVLAAIARIPDVHEIIVADASDGPECRAVAHAAGATVVSCPEPSRGKQMNAAAAVATGDVLLFQHADTEIAAPHADALRRAMLDPTLVGGAFHRRFHPMHRRRQRWLLPIVRRINASNNSTLWGDQSIFVRREHFLQMGGYAPIPMMEDMEFSKRLRRSGGRVLVIDPPLLSSARRHQAYGSLRASLEIFCVLWLYKLGVSPHRIHRHYYRRNRKGRHGPPVEAQLGPQHSATG
jgi:rSAM/selenodomain-associated transferase 2